MNATAGVRLHVTRSQILARGLVGRCPNCANRSLFPARSLQIRERCPFCELAFDPGGGFWLGPLVLNYTVSVVGFVAPILVLGVRDVLPLQLAIVLAVVIGAFGIPLLLYRLSWSWWVMLYYFFLPHRLPANGSGVGDEE